MMKNFTMKKFDFILFISMLIILFTPLVSTATMIEGGVNTNERVKPFCTVIDKLTGKPVPNAKVVIPSLNFVTYSDINGHFELKTSVSGNAILSVEKPNYKPFSMTLSKHNSYAPFVVEIELSNPFDIKVETALCHLGDNNYSGFSANAGQFKTYASGPVYNKSFFIPSSASGLQQYIVFGSIVGVDTAMARGMGQNRITTSFASPPSVWLNGHKIAEIQINGDNQKIKLPKQFIKYNQNNIITIKAGKNIMQTAYVDYDDFEFMNIHIESVKLQSGAHIGSI